MNKTTRHSRNVSAMHASPKCGAKTRSGTSCQAPQVSGGRRCRMHGGAKGSGAPTGNKNALKHGLHTREVREQRRAVARLIRETEKMLGELQ